jgi:tetratricopeptide (TPR) repeat protein
MGGHRYNFDLETAEQLLRRAIALEPDRPNTWNHLGLTLRNQGRLVESEAVFDTLIALGPWVQAYLHRSFVRYLRGNGVGALADFAEAEGLGSESSPHYPFWPALFSIAAGDSLPAQAWLELHYGRETSRADSNASIFLNIGLGRLEEALMLLEAMPRDLSMWTMLHNPFFEPLHDDPRFRRILEESRPERL